MSSAVSPPLLSPFHVDHDDDMPSPSFVHFSKALLSPKVCAHLRGFMRPAAAGGVVSSNLTAPRSQPTTPRVVRHRRSGGPGAGEGEGAEEEAGGYDADASKRLSIVVHSIGGVDGSSGGCSSKSSRPMVSPTAVTPATPIKSNGTSDGSGDGSCITTTTLSIPARTPAALTSWPPKSAWLSHHADTDEHKKHVGFSREVVVIVASDDEGEEHGEGAMVDVA